MIGQISDNEFKVLYDKAGQFRRGMNYSQGTAWLMYGKSTINFYIQHEDKSWTNYDCKTK
jgi:hypothetical protein